MIKPERTALIRLLRAGRTRRSAQEQKCPSFVVCIGGDKEDKKTKELKRHSEVVMLAAPSHEAIGRIIRRKNVEGNIDSIVRSVNRDLRRLGRVALYDSRIRTQGEQQRISQGSREHTADLLKRAVAGDPPGNWPLVPDP